MRKMRRETRRKVRCKHNSWKENVSSDVSSKVKPISSAFFFFARTTEASERNSVWIDTRCCFQFSAEHPDLVLCRTLSTLLRRTLAPASISSFTMLANPPAAAICSGVQPFFFIGIQKRVVLRERGVSAKARSLLVFSTHSLTPLLILCFLFRLLRSGASVLLLVFLALCFFAPSSPSSPSFFSLFLSLISPPARLPYPYTAIPLSTSPPLNYLDTTLSPPLLRRRNIPDSRVRQCQRGWSYARARETTRPLPARRGRPHARACAATCCRGSAQPA